MERKWPLGDLDNAQFQLKCAVNALEAIYDSMVDGPQNSDNYVPGLYSIWAQLYDISNEISDCVQACFDEKKQEKAGVA